MDEHENEMVNEVRLVGRVSVAPEHKVLPSGDELWTMRVVVSREVVTGKRRAVDALECAAWSGRARRSVSRWRAGDVVEVQGRLRRRFYATATGRASRVEVEVLGGRVIRRARTGTARPAAVSAGTTSP